MCPLPDCGDGVLDPGEACDDGNTNDCDGCKGDCSRLDDICGDNIAECGEVCDGTDDAACPGQCQADCTCPADGCPPCFCVILPSCGNGAMDAGEDCDIGSDGIPGTADDLDAACPGQCQADCTCPLPSPCELVECPCREDDECPGGLVPCGRTCDDPTTDICECCPCTLCHLFVLFKRIVDFVTINIIFPLAILMIVIGGVILLTAGGDPGRIGQGKKILKAAIIGVIIIIVAWLIVDTIIVLLTPAGSPFQAWYTINCPVP